MTVHEPVADILARLRDLPAEEILADAAGRYAGRVAFATSLGIDDQVVTHMIAEAGLGIPIFTVDTGRLFPETHDLIERTSERYGVSIAVYCPDAAELEQMVARDGVNLFRHSAFKRELCCETRKVRPLRRAQVGLDVWICARHGGAANTRRSSRPRGTRAPGWSRSTRWRRGTKPPSGTTPARTTCPTTRCTPRATPPSTARPARARYARRDGRRRPGAAAAAPTELRAAAGPSYHAIALFFNSKNCN